MVKSSFNSKSDTWWEQSKNKANQFKQVKFYQFDWQQIKALATFAKRTMDWSLSISGDTIYIAAENQECELVVSKLI